MEKISNIANALRASLGLLPAIMSAMAVALAWLLLFSGIDLESYYEGRIWWLFSGDAETARNLLSTLLSGMITMTSLVVSITMVVLSLTAGHLGPRIIVNFLKDRQIQLVLGLFMATIVYTLSVLRSLTTELEAEAVPHIAVSLASGLAMLCLFALLFYVQKIARSIMADTVVSHVADDLEGAIASAESEPDPGDESEEAEEIARYSRRDWISLGRSGYVQVIDHEKLVQLAAKKNLLVRLNCRAGHFLLRGGEHLELFSDTQPQNELIVELSRAFVIGASRSPTQDQEYSIRQLVEIAVRAMSPGINDPVTAILVVNRLGSALERASRQAGLPARFRDQQGRVRVLVQRHDFPSLLDVSFNQIRQSAASNAAVLIEMTGIIGQLAFVVEGAERRKALEAHLAKLDRAAHKNLDDPADVRDFERAAKAVRKKLIANNRPDTLMPEYDD